MDSRKVLNWRLSNTLDMEFCVAALKEVDNVMMERLWRSLKYNCVYLHAWETGSEARKGIGEWISRTTRSVLTPVWTTGPLMRHTGICPGLDMQGQMGY